MSATPLVFLHAFPLDSSMWDGTVQRFVGRTVLAPDFPGFGGRPATATSLDEFGATVVEEMVRANVERAVFVGLSMGGYVALRIHARWPERVAALILADTRAGADSAEAAERRSAQADRARREGTGWLADEMIPKLLGERTRREKPAVESAVREMVSRADREGVARALLAMRDRPDSTAALAAIAVPVLAIVGEEDALTPPSEARIIVEGVPRGELVTIAGAGHLSNLEDPDAFDSAVATFLESHDTT